MAKKVVTDQSDRVGAWVAAQVGQTASWGGFYAIGLEDECGQIVAGVVMNNYNGANATCHIAVAKPCKAMLDLFAAFCDYAFRYCKLKRLTGLVPSTELAVLAFDKKLGFELEAVLRDGAPGGDMCVLVMRPETCRWLKSKGEDHG